MRVMLAALVLALAACAHAFGAEPPAAVRTEQQDAPAISPWAEPPSHASIEESNPSSDVPADSDQAP